MHINIDGLKFGSYLQDCQTVKLKSPKNFPAIRQKKTVRFVNQDDEELKDEKLKVIQ